MHFFSSRRYQLRLECQPPVYKLKIFRRIDVDTLSLLAAHHGLENFDVLKQCLAKFLLGKTGKLGDKIEAIIIIPGDQCLTAVAAVPENYCEQDIEHYLQQEQASIFPQSKGELCFDFSIKQIENNQKKIVVFALEKSICQPLLELFENLKIKINYLGFEKNNFLPWRELNRKKEKKALCFSAVLGFVVALIFLFIFFSVENFNLQKVIKKTAGFQREAKTLKPLFNKSLRLKEYYKNKINSYQENRKQKYDLSSMLCVLQAVDTARPEDLVLKNISFHDRQIVVSGQAKNIFLVQKYRKNILAACKVSCVDIVSLSSAPADVFQRYFKVNILW